MRSRGGAIGMWSASADLPSFASADLPSFTSGDLGAFVLALLSTCLAVLALVPLAERSGLVDDPAAAPEKKRQAHPVPAVGGAAILLGLLAASAASGSFVPASGAWPALILAFALGLQDDRRRGGFAPGTLLLGQSAVAVALVASGWRVCAGEPAFAVPASFAAALLAMNCVNTFDNADGAATSLGILGLAARSPLLAAPLLGFLPFNLWIRRRGRDGKDRAGTPLAYLGNSGSHALGVLMVLDPVASAALLLPLLDLARLAVVRLASGSRPWAGDRQHLAHRLQRAGLAPPSVVLVLLAIASPAVLGAMSAQASPERAVLPLAVGVALTCATFALAVALSPRAP